MRVRDWEDIVEEVATSGADPEDWRAIAGDRAGGVGEDMYLGHPAVGLFQLKTYAKNPFEVRGVGSRVARKVDGDVASVLPEDDDSLFAVQTPPEDEEEAEQVQKRVTEVVRAHAAAPTEPEHFVEDLLDAVDAPAFGPIDYDQYDRPESLDEMATTFEEAEEVLETEFEEIVEDSEVGRGFQ